MLSIVVSVAVLVEVFRPLVVVPLTLVLVAVTWKVVPSSLEPTRRAVAGTLTALGIVVAWFVVNVPFAARFVVVTRDPGFLTLEAFWLSRNESPDLPLTNSSDLLATIEGVKVASAAYSVNGDVLNVQGAKLLPGILAVGGWVGGDVGVLIGNLIVGGVALLAVYSFARRLVGPLWGLVPLFVLAASVPFAAFTRAAYTEPLTVALGFAGLTMAWSAVSARSLVQYAGAGALIGATALARVDGAAQVIGLVAALGTASACALLPMVRRPLARGLVAASAAALILVGLGFLDLAVHSPNYLSNLSGQVTMVARALAFTLVGAAVLNVPRVWSPLARVVFRSRRGLAWGAASVVVLLAVVLASRPLWMENHHTPAGSPYAQFLEEIQALEGLPLDGSRSYDEMSVNWLTWYFGPPMVILAFSGLAIATYRAIRRRDPRFLVFVGVVAAPSALYLWRVSITPDQVWAMRRFLPVTIPGFLVAATLAIVVLWGLAQHWARAVAVLGTVTVVVWPLVTWGNLFTVVEQDGRYGEARAVCDAVGGRPIAVVGSPLPYEATLLSICGTDAVAVASGAPETLARVRDAWGGQVSVVAFRGDALPWAGTVPPPLRTTTETTWERTLERLPDDALTSQSQVWVGHVQPDGSVVPAPAAP